MSLDVMLLVDEPVARKGSGIFIRDGGQTREVTRFEWDARFPDREPVIFDSGEAETCLVYTGNVTHNLTDMAEAAGLYKALWRPEEVGITHARQLIGPLATGLVALREDVERFKPFAPKNGWGTYSGLLEFVRAYLEACLAYPDARVEVCR